MRVDGVRHALGLDRNVAVLAASLFGLGLGEELWQAYLPAYLTGLGASAVAVGAFASSKDLLDGLYQYPGGWLTDRVGQKRALLAFTLLATLGYLVYAAAPSWPVMFAGLVLVMAWKAGAFPATFAVIGDALPEGRRGIAFSVQSILVRVPRIVGAPAGGLLIAGLGLLAGLRAAFAATVFVGVVVLVTQQLGFRERPGRDRQAARRGVITILAAMPPALARLLVAECLVRVGEGLAAAFIVLYVLQVIGVPPPAYGVLYAVQQTVAILLYLPSGRLADVTGRRPLVALTFAFFALFPLAVRFATGFLSLAAAFIVGGLKEFGEPARKSLILDLADPTERGRVVGTYYTIRNLLVVPAGLAGGMLWQRAPELPLEVGCGVGALGLAIYLVAGSRQRPRAA